MQQCYTKACQYGRVEIVKLFLQDDRIDPFTRCNMALHRALIRAQRKLHHYPESYKLDEFSHKSTHRGNSEYSPKKYDRSNKEKFGDCYIENDHLGVVKLLLRDNRINSSAIKLVKQMIPSLII